LQVHLVDGTYDLFRHYCALPSARDQDGREVAAVRGVLASILGMIRGGATHVAVATQSRPPRGRPPIEIDLIEFEKLASLQCTQADIAG